MNLSNLKNKLVVTFKSKAKNLITKLGFEKDQKDFFLHEYKSYEEYKELQIFFNKKKIDRTWADKKTLDRVADILKDRYPKKIIKGLCHGSRNGFEQNYLNSLQVPINALGTDISHTAQDFDKSIVWDFHDQKEEWIGVHDFVYTNSLDQSWNPKRAIETWLNQLNQEGIIIIEHTKEHGPSASSKMDPFGVKPTVMPYILSMWFGHQISISHTVEKKENNLLDAWLFVINKHVEKVTAL